MSIQGFHYYFIDLLIFFGFSYLIFTHVFILYWKLGLVCLGPYIKVLEEDFNKASKKTAMGFQTSFLLLFNLSLLQQKMNKKYKSRQQPRTPAAVTFSPDWPRSTINVKKTLQLVSAPRGGCSWELCVCVPRNGGPLSPTAPEMAPPARPNRP